MQASGWGQEGNERTKLAYHCTLVSDKIHTAINYDSITTEARAIHEIKTYLNEAVILLTLQRLEMLRYKPIWSVTNSHDPTSNSDVQRVRGVCNDPRRNSHHCYA